MAERQIKSRERVAERGEVFTAEREVNAMLDLVNQETSVTTGITVNNEWDGETIIYF